MDTSGDYEDNDNKNKNDTIKNVFLLEGFTVSQ